MIRGTITFDVLRLFRLRNRDEFEDLFNNYEKTDYIYAQIRSFRKSKKHDVYFDFPNGIVTLQCSDWSEKIKQEIIWYISRIINQ